MLEHDVRVIPVLEEEKVQGMYVFQDVSRIKWGEREDFNVDADNRLRVGAAVSTHPESVERIEELLPYVDVIVIDTAQGDSVYAKASVDLFREKFPDTDIVAGNITDPPSAVFFAEHGADGVKVGQGSGSICTTRQELGIGVPQLSAVHFCARALEKYGIPVCSDGGIQVPGDISKAIAGGADSVMLGKLLAGTDESPGEREMNDKGQWVKNYSGMGSPENLKRRANQLRYVGGQIPEGVDAEIEYKGSVIDIMKHYAWALRRSMSESGSNSIADHRFRARLGRQTAAGVQEAVPHILLK
jgi:IMP dehydrogenase